MAKFNFDPSEVEASTYSSDQSYEIMPDGEYKLAGVDAEEKQTQKKNGSFGRHFERSKSNGIRNKTIFSRSARQTKKERQK